MLTIDGTTIKIPRRDIGSVKFHFKSNAPEATETVWFVVSAYPEADSALIKKSGIVTNSDIIFSFESTDTNLTPDCYAYSLRVEKTGGYDTVICTGEFEILEVVKV